MRRRSTSTYGSQSLELAVEDVERLQRRGVGGLVVEHGAVASSMARFGILDLALVEPRDRVEDLLLVAGIGRELALLLVDLEQIAVARGLRGRAARARRAPRAFSLSAS